MSRLDLEGPQLAENVRHGLLVRTCLEVLREAERPLRPAETAQRMADRIGEFTPYERETLANGRVRWQNTLHWGTGDMATVGWLSKTGGWRITDSGEQALETYPDDEDLQRALIRLRQQVYEERKRAVETLAPFEQQIAVALGEVPPGQWTSYQDIAAIAETSAETVASFLASRRVPNAHRVLREDGSPPPEGMLNQWLRGTDLRERLTSEDVEFGEDGCASQEQRVTADELRGHIESFTQVEPESRPQSAWLVRGSVDGYNLVPTWLGRVGSRWRPPGCRPRFRPRTGRRSRRRSRKRTTSRRTRSWTGWCGSSTRSCVRSGLATTSPPSTVGGCSSGRSPARPSSPTRRTAGPTCAAPCSGATRTPRWTTASWASSSSTCSVTSRMWST